jgi:hypothetical protein
MIIPVRKSDVVAIQTNAPHNERRPKSGALLQVQLTCWHYTSGTANGQIAYAKIGYNGALFKHKGGILMRGRIIFFGILALLAGSEMIFSNIGTLIGNIDATAAMLGVSVAAEQTRLLILIAFNLVVLIGSVWVCVALLRPATPINAQLGVRLASGGMIGYALYQVWSALFLLAPQWQMPILIVGAVYGLIGATAWWLGRPIA